MPAARSTSGAGKNGGGAKRSARRKPKKAAATAATAGESAAVAGRLADLADDVSPGVVSPRDLVVLTRDRIQEILDDAAARGRVTRTDANALASELVRKGRQQTEDLLADLEQLVGRGRGQIESATDRVLRTVGGTPSVPIAGYDELTSAQVRERLPALAPAELRRVGEYERRHANRKTVLDAVDRALA